MQFRNLRDLFERFSSEEICREYLVQQRWNGKPVCPHCGTDSKVYTIENGKRFKCGDKDCRKKFSVTVGTVFENSNIPLQTWFAALYICTAHKKGISSLQLHRDLGVTQKTAWFMLHRIREMLKADAPDMMKNTVEIDETYVGGKEKNKHANKRKKGTTGRSSMTKTPVLGIVERGGNVFAKKMIMANQEYVYPIIDSKVDKGTTVMTDSWAIYQRLDINYDHYVIDHSTGSYAHGQIHTNTIEGYWSLFKRSVFGIYHQISYKHTNAYLNEMSFRYNTRKISDPQRFQYSLTKANGKRIKYSELTHRFYFEK